MPRYRRSRVGGATYFFTVKIATAGSDLLVDHVAELRTAYSNVIREYPVETIAICILPDHLHAIWRLPADDDDYPSQWRRMKAEFSRFLPSSFVRSESKVRRGERGIWQRRFWEHRIRDDVDLLNHLHYVHFNPVKHGLVRRVIDWPYSTFHRDVRRGLFPEDWAGEFAPDDEGQFGE